MKKLFLLFLAFPLFLASCSDDKDEEVTVDNIVGTWTLRSGTADVKTSMPTIDAEIKEYFEQDIADDKDITTVTFKADGTYKVAFKDSEEMQEENGKYELKGNVLTLITVDEDGKEVRMPATISLEKDKLNIIQDMKQWWIDELEYDWPAGLKIEKVVFTQHYTRN